MNCRYTREEIPAMCCPHVWAGVYEKDHYILTTESGERVLCWPNAGWMNATDRSGRMWAPSPTLVIEMIELRDGIDIVRGLAKP